MFEVQLEWIVLNERILHVSLNCLLPFAFNLYLFSSRKGGWCQGRIQGGGTVGVWMLEKGREREEKLQNLGPPPP